MSSVVFPGKRAHFILKKDTWDHPDEIAYSSTTIAGFGGVSYASHISHKKYRLFYESTIPDSIIRCFWLFMAEGSSGERKGGIGIRFITERGLEEYPVEKDLIYRKLSLTSLLTEKEETLNFFDPEEKKAIVNLVLENSCFSDKAEVEKIKLIAEQVFSANSDISFFSFGGFPVKIPY